MIKHLIIHEENFRVESCTVFSKKPASTPALSSQDNIEQPSITPGNIFWLLG